MAAYSLDVRTRVLTDWDASMKAEDVAAKYRVQSRVGAPLGATAARDGGDRSPAPDQVPRAHPGGRSGGARAGVGDRAARPHAGGVARSGPNLGESHYYLAGAGTLEVHRQKNGTPRRTASA